MALLRLRLTWRCQWSGGSFPGIVVLQEIFGVNSHIRDVTERLAKEGYIAIAPALFQRLAPGFETGYTAEDIKIGKEYKDKPKQKNSE
jgi:carboxymethylenebutenolidase